MRKFLISVLFLFLFCPSVFADDYLIPVPDILPFFKIDDKGDILGFAGLAKNLSNNDLSIKKVAVSCSLSAPFCLKRGAMLSFEYRTPILSEFEDETYSDTFKITKRDNNYIVAESKNSIGISYIYIDLVNKTAIETISLNSSNEIIKYQILINPDEVNAEIKKIYKQYMSNK